jgi:hypothetical protein
VEAVWVEASEVVVEEGGGGDGGANPGPGLHQGESTRQGRARPLRSGPDPREGVRGEHEPFPARCQPCSEVSRGPCVGVHGGCVSLSLTHVVVGLLYGERRTIFSCCLR